MEKMSSDRKRGFYDFVSNGAYGAFGEKVHMKHAPMQEEHLRET
jgi:hypothetical protein